MKENQLRNTLSINSESINLKSDVLYNYNIDVPETTLLVNIEKWDLNTMGFVTGDGKKRI